ncbi:hypothetical protein [Pseudomonas sp. C9]|uniref:hypothetical protein n=1 Tax=Pseudomonas sp. C9 TaxID=1311337 RepID=UPI000984F567|nr:hypothetical protein [Pseudomonas sp. C9]OOG11272.1 hypothetical protein BMS17_03910 [Pseudomonas sp. C9]
METPPGSETERLKLRIEVLELELRKQSATPPLDSWWAKWINFLILPAAILGIVLQLTQASGDIKTQTKTDAETIKTKAETTKSLLETEKLQIELAELRQKGTAVPREEFEKLVPRLEASVGQLRTFQSQVQAIAFIQTLGKFIILWILFHAIGLIFDIFNQFWGPMVVGSYMFAIRDRDNLTARQRQYQKIVRKAGQWLVMALNAIPEVLRWSLQLSIFVALMIPLFNEVIRGFGSSLTFDTVIVQAQDLGIGQALAELKAILFAGAK